MPASSGRDRLCWVGFRSEGLSIDIVFGERAVDGGLTIDDTEEDASPDPALGQGDEEALDGVEPGGAGRLRHGPPGLLGRFARLLGKPHSNDPLAYRGAERRDAQETGLVAQQPVRAVGGETLLPAPDGGALGGDPYGRLTRLVRLTTFGSSQAGCSAMSDPGVFRLAAQPLRVIKTRTGPLPGTGWRRSDMTDRSGYSVEINLTRGEEGAALYINCRKALAVEVREHETDPEGALAEILRGTRSFSTWAKGSLRPVGGLPGQETTSLTEGQFSGDLFIVSNGLIWQAHALSAVEEEIAQMLAYAEREVLPQFLERVSDGSA